MAQGPVIKSWIWWWLAISAPLMVWDAGYVLLRPHTLKGGALAPIWKPYQLYSTIDLIYSTERWLTGDRFGEAQSMMNLVEVSLQVLALWLLRKGNNMVPAAVLCAFSTQLMTLWKTTLYMLYDIVGGYASSGHNTWFQFIFLYLIPDGAWIVMPLLAVVDLGGQLLRTLNHNHAVKHE